MVRANRDLWDGWTELHVPSEFYDVEGFKRGRDTLDAVELDGVLGAVGDIRGKSLLHLQCHFGLDTLSWARRGARVTGVDFSEKAVAHARRLARRAWRTRRPLPLQRRRHRHRRGGGRAGAASGSTWSSRRTG